MTYILIILLIIQAYRVYDTKEELRIANHNNKRD